MTIDLTNIVLKHGSHASREDGMCAMEAAAYVAGEDHRDHPKCVCPVIGAFMRSWNDNLPDDESRTRLLLPLIPKIINTVGSVKKESQRSWMALDWLARECAPAWLDAAGLGEHAAALRALAPIVGKESAKDSEDPLMEARKAAIATRVAAVDAVGGYALEAARVAALKYGSSTAWSAAGNAFSVADLVYSCSYSWNAIRASVTAADARKLAPTVETLQASAVHLVERMATI